MPRFRTHSTNLPAARIKSLEKKYRWFWAKEAVMENRHSNREKALFISKFSI